MFLHHNTLICSISPLKKGHKVTKFILILQTQTDNKTENSYYLIIDCKNTSLGTVRWV